MTNISPKQNNAKIKPKRFNTETWINTLQRNVL